MEQHRDGMTMTQLLCIVGGSLIAIAIVWYINPIELYLQAGDVRRFDDMQAINRAISLYATSDAGVAADPNAVYLSLPDANGSGDCANNYPSLPTLPPPWRYVCRPIDQYQKVDGTGWIPFNFMNLEMGTPMASLPVDPANTPDGEQYYTYIPGSPYILTARMMSRKYMQLRAMSDNGSDPTRLEFGGQSDNRWSDVIGLIGDWTMDANTIAGTRIADKSNRKNDGVLVNNPVIDSSGQVGGALLFNGINSYLELANPVSFDASAGFTIAAWVKSEHKTGAYHVIASFGQKNEGHYEFGYDVNDQKLSFYAPELLPQRVISESGVDNDEWHYVAVTYSGSAVTFFVDGAQKETVAVAGTLSNATDLFRIGEQTLEDKSMPFAGSIDEVRLYSRALSAAEIGLLYDAMK